jgi:hypothetical protein
MCNLSIYLHISVPTYYVYLPLSYLYVCPVYESGLFPPSVYLPTKRPTYLPTHIPICPTHLPIYLPNYLRTYLPTHRPTYLPTYP